MSRLEFTSIGVCAVVRITDRAVLFDIESKGSEYWVPLSVLSTATSAEIVLGNVIENTRVESWFVDKEELA